MTQGETSSLELGHYLQVLRRGAGVILVGLLLGALASVAYLAVATRTVTATTVVNLNVISSDPFDSQRSPSGLIDASTEMQLASSTEVLDVVAGDLGQGVTPSDVRSRMDATLVPDATVMRISYQGDDVSAAEAGADAIAQAYLDYRSKQADNRIKTIVDQLDRRRDQLRDDLVRINTIVDSSPPSSAEAVQAASDRQLVSIELDSLSGQINTYLGLDTAGGVVLTAAAENPTRIAPSRALVVATGLGAGLVAGIIGAFVLNAMRRRIRDGYDVRRAGGGEVLGELTSKRANLPATGEDQDRIRTVRELLLANLPADPPVIAVADITKGESVPDVAVSLAHAVAETGDCVDLVLT